LMWLPGRAGPFIHFEVPADVDIQLDYLLYVRD
jgi:hypothetical protein